MGTRLEKLRREVELARSRGEVRGIGYPGNLKERVIAAARDAIEAGATLHGVATSLGLSRTTLSKWLGSAKVEGAGFVPVVVDDEFMPTGERGLVVVTASGHRIEGLSVENAILLLRGLP